MGWKAILTNNTDFRHGAEFATIKELRGFVGKYYVGEEGNAYWEVWKVSYETLDDLPDGLWDLLIPNEQNDSWRLAKTSWGD